MKLIRNYIVCAFISSWILGNEKINKIQIVVARLATTHEKLVASRPNPVALMTPQVTTLNFDFLEQLKVQSLVGKDLCWCSIPGNDFCHELLRHSLCFLVWNSERLLFVKLSLTTKTYLLPDSVFGIGSMMSSAIL